MRDARLQRNIAHQRDSTNGKTGAYTIVPGQFLNPNVFTP